MIQKKNITQFVKIFVTIAVIGWIIRNYGLQKIFDTIAQSKIEWLIIGLLLNILSYYFGACQYRIILENKGINLSIFKTVKLYFIGMFFNNFVFGAVAGDTYRVTALHLDQKNGKSGFAATFIDRLAGLLTLSFFAIVAGSIILFTNIQENKQLFMAFGVLGLFVSIFVGIFLMVISKTLQTFSKKIINKFPNRKMRSFILDILEEIFINRRGKEERAMLVKIVGYSFLIQTLRITVHLFCAKALGIFTWSSAHYFFVIIPIVALLMLIPFPFGIRETIGGILFGLAGFMEEESVIMEFLATILGVAASLVGAIMFIVEKKDKNTC